MKFARIAAAFVVATMAAACLPVTSKTPVGSTVGFKPDPALYGVWRGEGKDSDGPGYMTFIRNEDDTMSAVLVTPARGTDDGDWEVFKLLPATLGGKQFFNASETYVKGKPSDGSDGLKNMPIFYRVEGKTLTLYLLDDDAMAAVVKSGKLKGTVSEGSDPDVNLTSDGPELDAFFAHAKIDSLIDKPLVVMTKVD